MTWYEDTYPDSKITDWDQATAAEADTYHNLRGTSLWTGSDEVKTQALQRAWDYLKGLNWLPDVFDTELPDDVKNAQIVAALEELQVPGALAPTLNADNYLSSKDVAGIKKQYRPGAPTHKRYLALETLLKPFIGSSMFPELRRG